LAGTFLDLYWCSGQHMNSPLPLSRQSDATLTEQLSGRFAEHIRQHLIAPGARLPSVRECARRHGVSPYTVVAAYDQLLAQGLVESRKQRGFFVRDQRRSAAPGDEPSISPSVLQPRMAAPVSATMLVRSMFQPPGSRPMPGLGTLPMDWLDLPMLSTALRRVSGASQLGALSLQYGEPAGDLRLRRVLSGGWGTWASRPRPSRSSPRWGRPRRSTS
jgi:DNA-binding transcriptional MocR family regulator